MFSSLTGRKVPRPTCRSTSTIFTPLAAIGGGGGAAPGHGIDGLIPLLVRQTLRDVGRQRHLPRTVQHLLEDAVIEELHPLAPVHGGVPQDLHGQLRRHLIDRAHLGPFGGLAEALPGIPLQPAQEQKLHGAAGLGPMADQTGGDDPGIVPHQHVPGVQVLEHVREHPVGDGPVAPVVDEEPGLAPHGGRGLGDQLLGQVVVKVARLQNAPLKTDSSLLYIANPFGATAKSVHFPQASLFIPLVVYFYLV